MFFQLRDALDLILHGGVARNALLFLELFQELVDVARATSEDFLGAFEHLDFGFEFLKSLLALFVLSVFLFEVGSILAEVVAL